MKHPIIRRSMLITLIVLVMIALLCFFYSGGIDQILGVMVGYLITLIIESACDIYALWNEDKNKISDKSFSYLPSVYLRSVTLGGKKTDLWYLPCVQGGEVKELTVEDTNDYRFQLDPIIVANYAAIIAAHRGSFIKNIPMIRLDGYTMQEGRLSLHVSRTMFYNDLVTNRSIDYKFSGDLTVRDIFESRPYMSSFEESRMSNHIGINALVFHGDELILSHRGANSTMSKGGVTAALALGLSEWDIRHSQELKQKEALVQPSDLTHGVVLEKLSGLFADLSYDAIRALFAANKICVYFLGFGQLVYTGGKPQFYYAITVDRDCPLKLITDHGSDKKIDYNQGHIRAKRIALHREGHDELLITGRTSASDKVPRNMVLKAEKSFFANWLHLQEHKRIPGVPDWVYEDHT